MSVALYLDQHVPKAIRRGLRARQVDVISAFEDETSDWDDESLLDRVQQLGRVLFTQMKTSSISPRGDRPLEFRLRESSSPVNETSRSSRRFEIWN